ncbi:ankyrin repeat and BTB/POZ domain-containing protein 2-like isoform X2 [Watersipora subatra]
MSSCDSEPSDSQHPSDWTSPTSSFTDSMPSSGSHDYSIGGSLNFSDSTGNLVKTASCDSYLAHPVLPDLNQLPWTEAEVLSVLQRGKFKDSCGNFSIEFLQRLSYLIQRPLVRIAREVERFSETCNKCSKHDMSSACKLILSPRLFSQSHKFASQCLWNYVLLSTGSNTSLGSMSLSIGKHQRWLIECLPNRYIHELAAVYLAATMESLIEQTVTLAMLSENQSIESQLGEKTIITTDTLETGIRKVQDLHSIYHPYAHLLPTSVSYPELGLTCSSSQNSHKQNSTSAKTVERNLLMNCVSSTPELSDIITQAIHYWCRGSSVIPKWSPAALNSLYYFLKCSKLECSHTAAPALFLRTERWNVPMPPIAEWVRVAKGFTEHRNEIIIDEDDVMQAARLLLPGMDCPPRSFRHSDLATSLELETVSADTYGQVGSTPRGIRGMKKTASHHLCKKGLDSLNAQGLTALMLACARGDEFAAFNLLEAGASCDACAPLSSSSWPGWTALCFAVANGHVTLVKFLLDYGCNVEGSAFEGTNAAETPLQIASATGQLELVTILTCHGAISIQSTYMQQGFEVKSSFNAFTLAAGHGRRDVLRWLFGEAVNTKSNNSLTLPEILSDSSNELLNRTAAEFHQEEENEYMVIENDYWTIEEMQPPEYNLALMEKRLSPTILQPLQSAMMKAAENGFLDLTLEIRATGLPWTLRIWSLTLNIAHATQRKAVVQSLLRDFTAIDYSKDIVQLCSSCLPLMFDIFKASKNEMISQQLAVIFSRLYGSRPLPLLKNARYNALPFIDSSFVNSKELADVSFVVERKRFYAHRVILSSASMRFKNMLSAFADDSMPEIEVQDITYDTFERVIHYIYEGKCISKISNSSDFKSVKRLLGAAHYFQLESLKRNCEILLSKSLSVDNCLSVYKVAKIHSCSDLLEICEAYLLQNFSWLLRKCEEFKRVLYSSKVHNRELINGLSLTLTARLSARLSNP